MKRLLTLIITVFILSISLSAQNEFNNEINVYLYNFEKFSYRWTNKFKKIDRTITYKPSVEVEIKTFTEREFAFSIELFESNNNRVFFKTQS